MPPRIRETEIGKKYGRLTIESLDGGGYVNCVCDCGNRIRVMHGDLVSRHTSSCGCIRAEKSVIGRRYGMLVVTGKVPGRTAYTCLCDCGNTCVKTLKSLTMYTNRLHCGCQDKPKEPKPKKEQVKRYEDLTGKRVDLSSVLDISAETGGPILRFKSSDGSMPDCFVELTEADR